MRRDLREFIWLRIRRNKRFMSFLSRVKKCKGLGIGKKIDFRDFNQISKLFNKKVELKTVLKSLCFCQKEFRKKEIWLGLFAPYLKIEI
jgi:hypothetical protein